jgi:hypothetical protein
MENKQNILVIGVSQAGKTHFGAQLYGKLQNDATFELRSTPNDLSIFKEICNNLNKGLAGKHTSKAQHDTISLPLKSKAGKEVDLVYPDYGGEQLSDMIDTKNINQIWQKRIQECNAWLLFIRLDMVEVIQDVTSRIINQFTPTSKEEPKTTINNLVLPRHSAVFYVELLQALLYTKQIPLINPHKPRLMVLLSCWDKLQHTEHTKPYEMLYEKLPMLYNFIQANWAKDNFEVLGLSSLGMDLDTKNANTEFAECPENFCYFITEEGEKERDITKILQYVI